MAADFVSRYQRDTPEFQGESPGLMRRLSQPPGSLRGFCLALPDRTGASRSEFTEMPAANVSCCSGAAASAD
jgi:hypothetical protein